MPVGVLSNCEVLAKPRSPGFSVARETVGSRLKKHPRPRERLVFGELRPVDGGTPILLEKPSLTVGQDRTSDVVIEHPSVSASHCHLEFREGHWFIEDLGSRDGIRVNGERVDRAWVPALSVVNIGAIEFDLQYSSSDSESNGNGAVSVQQLTKLDRAFKSVQSFKNRRLQVRADQPAPADLPKTLLGSLQPINGEYSIPLLYDELYLGRDPDCDVILPYLSVAKTHCVLRFQDGYWSVRDLNNNGITIDGNGTQEGWLLPGSVLGLGTQQFSMTYSTTAETPPPELAVPINEFDVSDEDVVAGDDSEVFDLDESALIDSDGEVEAATLEREPTACIPPPALDQPLQQVDEMLQSIEEFQPAIENQVPAEAVANAPESSTAGPSIESSADSLTNATTPKIGQTTSVRATSTPQFTAAPASRTRAPALPKTAPSRSDFALSRHQRIRQFLKDRNFDGLLLTRPSNIAWYTGGAEPPRGLFGQSTAALLLTAESATLLARRSETEVMFGTETAIQGLQLRTCDWPEGSQDFWKDWSRSKRVASDHPFDVGEDVSPEIASMRLPLSSLEIETLRKLGIRIARAIEKAAREFQRGDTEAQIAGDVASRLVRHDVVPVRIQVWGDGRGQACPNWTFRRDAVEHFCTISVIGRRQGLHVAVSRTVSFGTPAKELRWTHSDMLLAHATAMQAIRDQTPASDVLARAGNACEKLGFAPEWPATLPGCLTGYESCEAPISPQSSLRLQAGMPLIWQSSLGPARAVDTLLVRKTDSKVVTQTGEWPQVSMTIDNTRLYGQAVLQRPV